MRRISCRYRDGQHVPGVWAPSDAAEMRSSAVALLFPELAGTTEDTADGGTAPVELTVGVFPSERQQAVLEALQVSQRDNFMLILTTRTEIVHRGHDRRRREY
jgi:hypothetical protein